LTQEPYAVANAEPCGQRLHLCHQGTIADEIELPGVVLQPGQRAQKGRVILLGPEAGYHDKARRRPPRIGSEMLGQVGHAVVHRHNAVPGGEAGLHRELPVKLRDGDDLAGERSNQPFDLAVDRCLELRDTGSEVPTVGREQNRQP
jgi:hypothetical protein